jgi:DNA helicase II / ATP-dependent DNA helicase PcrA
MLARAHVSDDSIAIVRQRIELLPPESDLAALVHDLYAHEGWVQPANKRPNENAIFVSTIHGAKGMEFDVVFLPAFEDEIIPGGPGEFDNPHCAEMEEERRLAFVTLTRARHQVYISSCEVRPQRWGPPLQSKPSRFIKEMQTDIQQLEAAKHGYGG